MAEVIRVFSAPILLNGAPYRAQVSGRPNGHIWEGWLEFIAHDGSDVRRTRRETTQPDRAALDYWATGLSGTYLEGAFARALEPVVGRQPVVSESTFEAPAPNPAPDSVSTDRAVLDPFSVAPRAKSCCGAN